MLHKTLSANKNLIITSILAGVIVSLCAITPQIDLWMNCENKCNGIYAIVESDEQFYAAYLQSLMDGKPRRNSPYSGAVDSPETPQKEAGLYIQFLASYPLAFIGKALNLNITQLMILTSILAGFLSALAVYWLVFYFTQDEFCSFAGTLIVIFLGATVAGQGMTFCLFSSEGPYLSYNLIFLRRFVPAIAFPGMILFIAFLWKLFNSDSDRTKLKFTILAFFAFTYCVYSYFYFWTTLFAWFFGLLILLGIFHIDKLKENSKYVLGLGISLIVVLIPYFLMLSNREMETDGVLALASTHKPDLFQIPELFSYAATIVIFLAAKFRLIELKDLRIIFLLSLNLVTVIVFNQQVITGRSIQPYHYLFYCANYLVTFSSFSLIYILLKEAMGLEKLKVLMVFLVSFALCVGIFDSIYSASISSSINLWRDELVPVAEKIKAISQTPEFKSEKQGGVILSFDFTNNFYFTGIDLPAITSQPVLWGPHAFYLPDVTHQKNIRLLHTLHYYQNVSKERLKSDFFHGMGWEAYGYLGPAKMSKIQTGKEVSIKPEEVDIIVEDYDRFFQNFSFQDAQNPVISFVLVNKKAENDFTNLDLWYQRDQGEVVGNYILYRVKLRQN